MEEAFQKTFLAITPTDRVLLGVSGGVDSMVLLHLFHKTQHPIVVAHYDHKLRKESASDCRFVKSYCKRHQIPFISEIRKARNTSEGSFRRLRRSFLRRVCCSHDCQWIATAHHFDDNLETLLMRLIRGSSVRGLSGMKPKNGVWLKPLLKMSREEIVKYAMKYNIPYRDDSSNQTLAYFRNRVRHQLVPHVRKLALEFGEERQFQKRLNGLFFDLRLASREMERAVRRLKKRAVLETDFFVRLDLKKVEGRGLTQALIHSILSSLTYKEMTRLDVERVVDALVKRHRALSVPGKIQVSYSQGFAYFMNEKHAQARERLKRVLATQDLALPFPGARLSSGEKLFRWLQNKRIPRWERDIIPVSVDSAENIVTEIYAPVYSVIKVDRRDWIKIFPHL